MPPCSNPTQWRTAASVKFGLMLLRPTTVLSGQVNQASFTYPMTQFTYDGGSGSFASTRTGMELLLGSTPGDDDLGRTVIHDPASTDTVYIAAVSQGVRDGELAFADNVYFTITNLYPPFAKIPFIDDDGNEFKWRNLVLQPLQPKANSGSGYADWPDPVTGLITVPFDGSASYDLANGGALTHAWDFADGSPASSSSEVPGNVTFPVGFRYVRHTVTSTSSQNHTEVIPVYNPGLPGAYDDMYIENFAITAHHVEAKGQQISIRIDQDIPMDEFPDNMLCMVWSRTYWSDGTTGQVNVSLGPPGREHMIFIGYHDTDPSSSTGTKTGLDIETTLNFLDVAGKLRGLPGFTQLLERAATATNWHEMVHLNVNREYIDYILRWQSNTLEIADFNPYTTEYPVSTLGSDGMSLYDQADQRARAMACELTCDREGNLWVMPDPELLATQAQADSVPEAIPVRTDVVIISLASSDWTDIKYTRQRPPKYHWLRGNCILCSVTNAANVVNVPLAFVIAPGPVPGWGLDETEQGEQVALNLYELQFREGNRYAAILNNFEGNFEIPITWTGDAGIDPAYKQWVQVTLPLTSAAYRRLHFTDALMLPDSLEITYDFESGTRFYTMQADRNTVGYQAPEDPQPINTLPTFDAPVEQAIPPTPRSDTIPATHDGGTVIVLTQTHIAITITWLNGTVTYQDITGTGATGNFWALQLDPFSSFLGPAQSGDLGAWLLTDDGLFYTANILTNSPVWTLENALAPSITSDAPIGSIRASTNTPGVIYVAWVDSGGGRQVHVARLSAYGATADWTYTSTDWNDAGVGPGLDIDHYGSDEALVGVRNTALHVQTVYRFVNGTPTHLTGTDTAQADGFAVSFIQKPLFAFGGGNNSDIDGSESFIYFDFVGGLETTVNGGTSITNIAPGTWMAGSVAPGTTSSIVATDNDQVVAFIIPSGTLFTTTDLGGSWTNAGTDAAGQSRSIGFFPRQIAGQYALFMSGSSHVVYSPDFGVTLIDKTGDLATVVGTIGYINGAIPLY